MKKTGIKDINGREIMLGDTVMVTNSTSHRKRKFDVTFEDGAFCIRLKRTKAFHLAVTIRDLIGQAKKAGTLPKIEILD